MIGGFVVGVPTVVIMVFGTLWITRHLRNDVTRVSTVLSQTL